MKKALCLAALFVLVASANADVRLFVTSSADPYGLNETANHAIASFSTVDAGGVNTNAYDYYNSMLGGGNWPPGSAGKGFSVTNFAPDGSPQGTAASPVVIQPGKFAYIWFQFANEANGSKIKGLKVTINTVGGGETPTTVLMPTYYYQNDKQNLSSQYRWDGACTQPGQPEFHNNPQTLVGVTSPGISADRLDSAWNLYDYQSKSGTGTTGVYLLGAIDPLVLGQNVYQIGIMSYNDIEYASGGPGDLVHGYFKCIPEPASALLLGLASLLIRRR